MHSAFRKTTLREIRNSFSRFLAIFLIVALGVGFFAGLRATKSAMIKTGDRYLSEHELFDYRLVSTLGFDPEDVQTIARAEGVRLAEGSVFSDGIFQFDGAEYVFCAHSVTEDVNTLSLVAGRLPQRENECVVDRLFFSPDAIGQQIVLTSANDEDTLDRFACETYTITGIVDSPLYLNFERGTSALGNGMVSAFVYLPRDGFAVEYEMEVFLRLEEGGTIYSDAYEDAVENAEDAVTAAGEQAAQDRYQRLLRDARQELDDAKEDYDSEWQDYQQERADAEQELADAEQEIRDGEQKLADSEKEWKRAGNLLSDGEKQLQQQKDLLAKSRAEWEAKKAAAEAELDGAAQKIALVKKSGEPAAILASKGLEQELAQKRELALQQLNAAKAELDRAQLQIDAGEKQLKEQRKEWNRAKKELDDARKELDDAKVEYADAKAEADEKFADAEQEFADAREEIADAERELAELEEPECFVLDRQTNTGYVCFDSDSSIVEGVAKVFPIFFFLIAALVCMTTMTRMVDEQRTQIGVMKALGYSRAAVMLKFMLYSGSAAVLGCIVGYAVGTWLFPVAIWKAYGLMYGFAPILYVFDLPLALISLAVTLICSVGTTWLACNKEFSSTPADLVRPKAPKAGKRVLLERVTFLWKRFSFFQKISVRNILRYKKRMIMMLLGVGGCTALLITGLGLRDSISGIADAQYGEIMQYDYAITYSEPQTEPPVAEGVSDAVLVYAGSADLLLEGKSKNINVIGFENGTLDTFLHLHTKQKQPIPFPKDGEVVINSKLASDFGIRTGDTVVIRDADFHELKLQVSGIFENYVYHFAIISYDSYQTQLGWQPDCKTAYAHKVAAADVHQVAAALMNGENVSNVTVSEDVCTRIDNMMTSLDAIVWLVIFCAAALAMVVMFNLSNINITERIREIATIKVLGFTRKETSSYIFRENLVLTVIGILVGALGGKALHLYVMDQINIDYIAFNIQVLWSSYLIAAAVTLLLAWLIEKILQRRLARINMAESLKSVE